MTEHDAATKERHLAMVVAEHKQAAQRSASLAKKRDSIIRELVAHGGYGSGARLAKLTGLTRVRIHQIAKG